MPSDSALVIPFMGKRAWSAIRIDLPAGTCGSDCSVLEPQADHRPASRDRDRLGGLDHENRERPRSRRARRRRLPGLRPRHGRSAVSDRTRSAHDRLRDEWPRSRHGARRRNTQLGRLPAPRICTRTPGRARRIVEDGIDSVDPGRLLTGAEALPEAPSQGCAKSRRTCCSSLEDVTPVLFMISCTPWAWRSSVLTQRLHRHRHRDARQPRCSDPSSATRCS